MKNVKLLLAFAVGVVLTHIVNQSELIPFSMPDFRLSRWQNGNNTTLIPLHWHDGNNNFSILLVIILLAALFLKAESTFPEAPQGRLENFFQSLRKLKRSSADGWFGGVCGGLGEQTRIPAWIWRLGFVLAVTYYGTGILAYILLCVFMPKRSSGEDATQTPGSHTRENFFEFLRHYRLSSRDCQIGGVCGGLGEHTVVPSWMWRIAFSGLMLCYGVGLVPYILLWIFVPVADDKAEANGKQQSPA